MKTFTITHRDKSTNARIGLLFTKKGPVETPFFMPVATKASAKFINSIQLSEIGIPTIISNAFILSINPGVKIIKKMGGIGKFMNFFGINVTDSGGFQMYSPSIFIKASDRGVTFKNPISGEKIFMTPEENMKLQFEIGSEIAMTLDEMPMYEDSKSHIQDAVRKTTIWAKRCKATHDKLQKSLPKNKRQLLFGITQGGIYKDLREKSIKDIKELDFDGYSIGGFGLGETNYEEFKIIELTKKILPEDKPIYLMGIGDPLEIIEGILRGCDMFDSRLPTQNARRGTLFTSIGKLKILNKKYEYDPSPIDKNCSCMVCKNFTKAYIRFLLREQESVGKELASYHNLYYLNNLILDAKKAIKNNSLKNLRDKIRKLYKN